MKSTISSTVFLACMAHFSGYGQAINNNLKLNNIQVIGSHNSYRQALDPALYKVLEAKDSTHSLSSIQYTHINIIKQLDMGLRNLEIDIYPDSKGGRYAHPKGLDMAQQPAYDPDGEMNKPGFKVFHMPDIDFRTSVYTFEDCLKKLKAWSDAHPGHTPVFITLEPKGGGKSLFGTTPEAFTPALFDEMDKVIQTNLGSNKLITPDMVRGRYTTLEDAVLHNNWPALKEASGRFLILLDDSGDRMKMYMDGHPSLKGRVAFVNAQPGTPEAAAMFRNNPDDASIPGLVEKGYIIRTRADEGTKEARANDYTHFKDAQKSGAQVITTDYYLPSTLFNSPYHIIFDDGTYVRLNPVNKGAAKK